MNVAETSTYGWTIDSTAAEIVRRHPHMLEFFDSMGVDDCCLELDLRTIAAHHGHDLDALMDKVIDALRGDTQAGSA